MSYEYILVDIEDGVALITLNRPEALNALNPQSIRELQSAVADMHAQPEVRCMILTGAGKKAFCAGADIKDQVDMDHNGALFFSREGKKLLETLERGDKPVIAAVNGYALGGGAEVAMACDLRIASDNAKFSLPEIKLAVVSGFGGTVRLPRIVGKTKAKELLLLGEMIDAEEGCRLGLFNKVVEQEELLPTAKRMARTIGDMSQPCVAALKQLVNVGMETDQNSAMELETTTYARLFANVDKKEGMLAFIEKRKPKFLNK